MIIRILLFIFGSSWRTTALGYGTAIAYNLLPILKSKQWTWEDLLVGIVIAIFSRLVQEEKRDDFSRPPDML